MRKYKSYKMKHNLLINNYLGESYPLVTLWIETVDNMYVPISSTDH